MIQIASRKSPIADLQAIVDVEVAHRAGWRPDDLARAYLDGGARFLQVRAKQLSSRPFLDLCDGVVRAAESYGAQVIVNDRIDLARMSGAAGAHVGQDDLPPADARLQLGPGAIVGFSTHSVAQVEAALHEPITYLAVGPVFGTSTKDTGYTAVGLELVATAAKRAAHVPIVAIGGVTLERAPAALKAGASCVAVIGDLVASGDPSSRVRAYLTALASRT
jgi:thiamine-phosphate pyrophosphorylase